MNLPLQSLIILIYCGYQLINAATIPTKQENKCNYKSNSDEAYKILAKIINDFEEDNFGDEVTNKICKHIELWNRLGEIVKKVQNNCEDVHKSSINDAKYYETEIKDNADEENEFYEPTDDKKKETQSHRDISNSEEYEGEPKYMHGPRALLEHEKLASAELSYKENTQNSKEKGSINNRREKGPIFEKDFKTEDRNSKEDENIKPNKHNKKIIDRGEIERQKRPKTEKGDPERSIENNYDIHKPNPEEEKPKTKKQKVDEDIIYFENERKLNRPHKEDKPQNNRKKDGESSGKQKSRNKNTDIEYHPKVSEADDASDALALIVDKNNYQTICNRKRYPIYADSEACKSFHAQLSR